MSGLACSQPPPDTPFDMSEPEPDGYRWELWPEEDWRLAEGHERTRMCRRPGCQHRPVAALRRSVKGTAGVWYLYCSDHLYGRVIIDGVVMCRRSIPVQPGEPG